MDEKLTMFQDVSGITDLPLAIQILESHQWDLEVCGIGNGTGGPASMAEVVPGRCGGVRTCELGLSQTLASVYAFPPLPRASLLRSACRTQQRSLKRRKGGTFAHTPFSTSPHLAAGDRDSIGAGAGRCARSGVGARACQTTDLPTALTPVLAAVLASCLKVRVACS